MSVLGKITGRDKFKEAEELYKKTEKLFNDNKSKYDRNRESIVLEVNQCVSSINKNKEVIHNELFNDMANYLKKLKDIEYPDGFHSEGFSSSKVSYDIKSRQELFEINFISLGLKELVLGYLTGGLSIGIFARKEATEQMKAVEEIKDGVDTDIKNMNAEILELRAILESLKNVNMYFSEMVSLYKQLLIRVDNSVHFLVLNSMRLSRKLVNKPLSIRMMPECYQKEIEATITISKILNKMTQAKLTGECDKEKIDVFEGNMKQCKEEIMHNFNAA